MGTEANDNAVTIAAIGLLAYASADFAHHALGHGGAVPIRILDSGLLMGGTFQRAPSSCPRIPPRRLAGRGRSGPCAGRNTRLGRMLFGSPT